MSYRNSSLESTVSSVNNTITNCLDYLIMIAGQSVGFESNCAPSFSIKDSKTQYPDMPVISHEELVEDMEALGVKLTYQPFGIYLHAGDSQKQEVQFTISVQDISEDGFDSAYQVAFIRSFEA